jgi:Fe-S cluster biogenesis protein NfuA
MFIQTEETPNPQSLKFLPGRKVMGEEQPLSFTDSGLCENSPFAKQLLEIEGVTGVFLGSDFVTITKKPDADWFTLKPFILNSLMKLFVNDFPVILDKIDTDTAVNDSDDPIVKQIKELLNTRIRPAVAQDGGDIVFDSFQEGIVYLKMQGSCSGCPSSSATLKTGIENMLKYYVPEVTEVRQVGY